MFVFFFSSRRRHTRSYGDWSSDVCSSDLSPGSAPSSFSNFRSSCFASVLLAVFFLRNGRWWWPRRRRWIRRQTGQQPTVLHHILVVFRQGCTKKMPALRVSHKIKVVRPRRL